MEILVKSLVELEIAAKELVKEFDNKKVILFYGDMGVGKTTFIKEICKLIGVEQEVTSPTFAIVNEYISPKYPLIYHFDFYRIEKTSEIYDIGFEEYIDSDALIFIEWPEMLEELVPQESLRVDINEIKDAFRVIKW